MFVYLFVFNIYTCLAASTSFKIVLNAASPSACFCCNKAIFSENFRGLLILDRYEYYIEWRKEKEKKETRV